MSTYVVHVYNNIKRKISTAHSACILTGILDKGGEGCTILLDNGTEFHNKSSFTACDQQGKK